MPDKPKIGFYWCASCGGCEEAVVDLAEDILGVVEAVDIVFWPVAMDFKKKHVEAMPDRSIVATLLNGAIRTSEQEEMAHLLRRKSQFLIAYGACAQLGGIPGLANQFSREQILRYVYEEAPTVVNEAKTRPRTSFQNNGHTVTLPEFHNVVRALDQVVDVDLLHPRLPAHAKNHESGHRRTAGRQAAAQRQRAGARHGPVRPVPAQGQQTRRLGLHGVQASASGHA